MDLKYLIEVAEFQNKKILEEFFVSCYNENYLPSHGIDHHRRVWQYAKELMTILTPFPVNDLPHKLIIASYMHDIGMSVETGISHGKHSSDLCSKFLIANNLHMADYSDVLNVIENHDRKDYASIPHINDLFKILSIADDLDAFGFIGIYRYTEIYLTRGIEQKKLGQHIIINAKNRFDNFKNIFGTFNELIERESKRYEILHLFFESYNRQIQDYTFGKGNPEGYCGVIELLTDVSNNKRLLYDLCCNQKKYSDPVFNWFFPGLSDELSPEKQI
jgi:HD superfamily phosphodiesterase